MKKLFLVRHGKSEANVNYDILQTKADKDVELVDEGYLDAVKAGQTLKPLLRENQDPEGPGHDEPFFIVSPWTRAYQTFQVISTVLNLPDNSDIIIDEEVKEHDMNLKDNPENWAKFLKYKNSEWSVEEHFNTKFEGGESLVDVKERAKTFLGFVEELSLSLGHNNIVVVSHGQFIKMVLSILDGTDPAKTEHPKNGEVIVREIK